MFQNGKFDIFFQFIAKIFIIFMILVFDVFFISNFAIMFFEIDFALSYGDKFL